MSHPSHAKICWWCEGVLVYKPNLAKWWCQIDGCQRYRWSDKEIDGQTRKNTRSSTPTQTLRRVQLLLQESALRSRRS